MDDYGIKSGYVTKAALDADSDTFFVNWKALVTTGDANAISKRWSISTSNAYQLGVERVYGMDDRARDIGSNTVSQWSMVLSTDMAQYLEATIFSGLPDALVTIKTYDQYSGTWVAIQCIVERPRNVESIYEPINNTYFRKFTLTFRECREAPDS